MDFISNDHSLLQFIFQQSTRADKFKNHQVVIVSGKSGVKQKEHIFSSSSIFSIFHSIVQSIGCRPRPLFHNASIIMKFWSCFMQPTQGTHYAIIFSELILNYEQNGKSFSYRQGQCEETLQNLLFVCLHCRCRPVKKHQHTHKNNRSSHVNSRCLS